MKAIFMTVTALILCLSLIGCAQKKPVEQLGSSSETTGTDPIVTTTPEDVTTLPDTDDLPDPVCPDWVSSEGYTVVSSAVMTVAVTEDDATVNLPARALVMQNDGGVPVLYFDVIANDNTVLCSKVWRGYCQMYMNSEGEIIVFQVVVGTRDNGTASYTHYEISDEKLSGYDVVELEAPEINAVPGKGSTTSFGIGSEALLDRFRLQYMDLCYGLQDALKQQKDKALFMIADSYLDPESPSVYSYSENVTPPDFENREISDKYQLQYIFDLYA